jgi:hypothetical protein
MAKDWKFHTRMKSSFFSRRVGLIKNYSNSIKECYAIPIWSSDDSVVQLARHKRVGSRPDLDLSVHGALHDGCPSFFCVPLLRLLYEYGPIILSP